MAGRFFETSPILHIFHILLSRQRATLRNAIGRTLVQNDNDAEKGKHMTYSDFLKNAIIETISMTTDEKLLHYIYTMLMSATPAETLQEDS